MSIDKSGSCYRLVELNDQKTHKSKNWGQFSHMVQTGILPLCTIILNLVHNLLVLMMRIDNAAYQTLFVYESAKREDGIIIWGIALPAPEQGCCIELEYFIC